MQSQRDAVWEKKQEIERLLGQVAMAKRDVEVEQGRVKTLEAEAHRGHVGNAGRVAMSREEALGQQGRAMSNTEMEPAGLTRHYQGQTASPPGDETQPQQQFAPGCMPMTTAQHQQAMDNAPAVHR